MKLFFVVVRIGLLFLGIISDIIFWLFCRCILWIFVVVFFIGWSVRSFLFVFGLCLILLVLLLWSFLLKWIILFVLENNIMLLLLWVILILISLFFLFRLMVIILFECGWEYRFRLVFLIVLFVVVISINLFFLNFLIGRIVVICLFFLSGRMLIIGCLCVLWLVNGNWYIFN